MNSTNGKYLVEILTVSRFASNCASLVSRKRRVNDRSRPNACTTRTPASPSCSVARFVPIRSRTSRYAALAALRNQRVARTTGGTTTSMQSASCQLRMKITTIAPQKSSAFCTNIARPIWTSSCSASTSEVSRDTSRPVRSRSKKSRPSDTRWRNTRTRRSRRNVSPILAIARIDARPKNSASDGDAQVEDRGLVQCGGVALAKTRVDPVRHQRRARRAGTPSARRAARRRRSSWRATGAASARGAAARPSPARG